MFFFKFIFPTCSAAATGAATCCLTLNTKPKVIISNEEIKEVFIEGSDSSETIFDSNLIKTGYLTDATIVEENTIPKSIHKTQIEASRPLDVVIDSNFMENNSINSITRIEENTFLHQSVVEGQRQINLVKNTEEPLIEKNSGSAIVTEEISFNKLNQIKATSKINEISIEGSNQIETTIDKNLIENDYLTDVTTEEVETNSENLIKVYDALAKAEYHINNIIGDVPVQYVNWTITGYKIIAAARFKEKAPLEIQIGTKEIPKMCLLQVRPKDGKLTKQKAEQIVKICQDIFNK